MAKFGLGAFRRKIALRRPYRKYHLLLLSGMYQAFALPRRAYYIWLEV